MSPEILALLRRAPIYVTGMGAVSAAGRGVDSLWDACLRGTGLAREVDGRAACRLDASSPNSSSIIARHLDPSASLSLDAAQQAFSSAGLEAGELSQLAVIGASSRGPKKKWEEGYDRARAGRPILPSLAVNSTQASLSGAIAHALGADALSATVSATCASGAHAIAMGAEQLLLGQARAVLVGGADCGSHPLVHDQMLAAGTVGHHEDPALVCRPFDRERNGLVPGDGAGMLLLESASSVEERGAKPLAQLAGWGLKTSTGGRSGVVAEGIVRALEDAMRLAEIGPSEIGAINAHATGTILNDAEEAVAYRQALKGAEVPITSTKPVTGHCLGGTPALEAILSIRSLLEGVVPPTAGLKNPDVATEGLRLVRDNVEPFEGGVAVSCSHGFWSTHASLVFAAA